MKKILCPTDFSKTATNAVEVAAMVAHYLQASLTLLHVIHLPLIDTTEMALEANEVLENQKQHSLEKLTNMCQHLTQKHGQGFCEYDLIVKEALLADAVKNLCRTETFEMVVVGTTGGGNSLEEILIGSNTQAVIEGVKCPVLAVPAKTPVQPFRHLVFASNYQPEDAEAIQRLLKLAAIFNAEVNMVHVSQKEGTDSQSNANKYRENLQAQLPGIPLQFQEIIHPDEVEGLKGFLTTTQADLLVVLKKHKGFLSNLFSQSLSEQMTYQTKLPLLVYHA
ncbi:universal stress protein [Adhaeribacter radiodurans]|uniref:Universal stress protein n=1 Tax=Adhaeribacter radiodurans TaxID=2745197 RepID=A0A7L7L9I0_9BACT|nr:universal stress protein [Adhaeribacter radiodurans]QMU29478.1 universal stress protein [Adhaeribacter radiodurans]